MRSHDPVETTLVVSDLLDLISETQIFTQANMLTQQLSKGLMLIWKNAFRYYIGECIYHISGIYLLSFGQGSRNTHTPKYEDKYETPLKATSYG